MRAKPPESIHFQERTFRLKSPAPLEELPSALGSTQNPDEFLHKICSQSAFVEVFEDSGNRELFSRGQVQMVPARIFRVRKVHLVRFRLYVRADSPQSFCCVKTASTFMLSETNRDKKSVPTIMQLQEVNHGLCLSSERDVSEREEMCRFELSPGRPGAVSKSSTYPELNWQCDLVAPFGENKASDHELFVGDSGPSMPNN
jgi:hypothetical protein